MIVSAGSHLHREEQPFFFPLTGYIPQREAGGRKVQALQVVLEMDSTKPNHMRLTGEGLYVLNDDVNVPFK